MKKLILAGLLAMSASAFAGNGMSEVQEKHFKKLKELGVTTEQQLCKYAGRGSMTGGRWDGKNCTFPAMFSYDKYRTLFNDLKPLLSNLKPSFDLQGYINKMNQQTKSPRKNDVNFAGLSGVSSYLQVADKLCSLDFITTIDRKEKANFCRSPESFIIDTLTFNDAAKDVFVFKGNRVNILAGNVLEFKAQKITIEGVDFDVLVKFSSPGWKDIDAIKGMLIKGDLPMEFVKDGHYLAKYFLSEIQLRPVDRNNRTLFKDRYTKIQSFFKSKFPGKVYSSQTSASSKGTDLIEVINKNGAYVAYKFIHSIDLEKYKKLYTHSLRSDKKNSDI